MKNNSGKLMTSGNIPVQIILFSFPLILGNLFQLLYSTVDSVVVGKFVGNDALASIGATSPVINLIIGLFMGLSTGASVVVSRYFGAQKYDKAKDSLHTFIAFGFIFGTLLSLIGFFFSSSILRIMSTPENIIDMASLYLKIYFIGCLSMCMYNAGTGILRAFGDSKHPLIFLIISSVLNVILDLLFVLGFKMSVAGAALATIISQTVSAFLTIRALTKIDPSYALVFSHLKIDPQLLKEIVNVGFPAGLQQMIVSFSNAIVQFYINGFGAASIAAFSSAFKIADFVSLPVQCISLGITTFAGQNLGAREYARVSRGVFWSCVISMSMIVMVGIPVLLNSAYFLSFFTDNLETQRIGTEMLSVIIPGYLPFAVHMMLSATLRASGRSIVPMAISVFCFTILRQIFLGIVMPIYNSMFFIEFCYPFTWVCATILTSTYYYFTHWMEKEELKNRI